MFESWSAFAVGSISDEVLKELNPLAVVLSLAATEPIECDLDDQQEVAVFRIVTSAPEKRFSVAISHEVKSSGYINVARCRVVVTAARCGQVLVVETSVIEKNGIGALGERGRVCIAFLVSFRGGEGEGHGGAEACCTLGP